MKVIFLSVFVIGLLPFSHGFAQNPVLPVCASASSDSDGDGYGWENSASCRVAVGSDVSTTGQCEDRGGYPWGWNPTTLESCRLDGQVQIPNPPVEADPTVCIDTVPLNDGWGWDGAKSCRIADAINLPGECVDVLPLFDGFGWNGVESCIVQTDTPLMILPRVDSGIRAGGNTRIYLSDDANIAAYTRSNPVPDFCCYRGQAYLTTLLDTASTLISASASGMEANANSSVLGMSGDGQKVLISSSARNLRGVPVEVAQQPSLSVQLYLFDRSTNNLSLITAGPDGLPAASNPYGSHFGHKRISANGNFIAYVSDATNLVSNDQNNEDDVFQFNATTGITTRISTDINNADLDDDSMLIDQSADGRFVLWGTKASNTISSTPAADNCCRRLYLYDAVTQNSTGLQLEIVSAAYRARVSNDGQIVVDNRDDIQLFDSQTQITVQLDLESPAWDGQFRGSNVRSADPEISPDGRYVAFVSKKENLLGNETLSVDHKNLYLKDTLTGMTTLVSRSASGSGTDADIEDFNFTRNGKKLYFRTSARNLIPPGNTDRDDWFVFDIDGQ